MIISASLVILLCITFVLLFLFIRTIHKRKWLTLLVSIGLTPLVYFYGVYPMVNIFSSYHHQKYFSSEAWIDRPALRYEMADDLMNSNLLIDKNKTEIESLLGQYEWLSWNETLKDHDTNAWNYNLGIEPGAFTTEKECLEITFNDNRVFNFRTYNELITFDDKE